MTNLALQLNQLFSDPLLAQSLKGGNPLLGQLMQGANTGEKKAQAFGGLLSSLMATRTNPLLEMTPATDTPKTDLTQSDLLKGLPDDLLTLINANAAAQKSDDVTDGILDALSSTPINTQGKNNLFAVIDDPELASALAGFAAKLQALHTGVEPTLLQTDLNNATGMSDALAKLNDFANRLQNDTSLSIADTDLKTFQAIKKLAYTDIAPFLTQTRNVVVDGKSVMKVAGGPAFLSEDNTDITALALDLALQPVINQALIHAQQTQPTPAIDTLLLAQSAPQSLPLQNAASSPLTGTTPSGDALADATGKPATPPSAAQTISTPNTPAMNVQQSASPTTQGSGEKTPSTAQSRGFTNASFADAMDDASIANGDSLDFLTLKPTADSNNPQNAASTLMHAARAGQPHPSTHLVSVTIARNLNPSTPGSERNLIINMEPESLGRVQVTLQFGENKTLKVHLVAERPEALALMQKDLGALERTLANAGLDTSASDSFTFDLASGDDFAEQMSQDSGDNAQNSSSKQSDDEFGTPLANIETVMPIFVDPNTGLTHVNIVV